MRKGLLRKVQPPPGPATGDVLSRIQDAVSDAFDVVTTDHDVMSSPAVRLVATAAIPPGTAVAVFAGGPSCTLSLPTAAAQGLGVGVVLHVLNLSTVAVTLARSAADTVNGAASMSMAAGKLAIAVADGVTSWKVATS